MKNCEEIEGKAYDENHRGGRRGQGVRVVEDGRWAATVIDHMR